MIKGNEAIMEIGAKSRSVTYGTPATTAGLTAMAPLAPTKSV